MALHYNMYKPINFRSGLFSELRYMSNGLTFEILNGFSRNSQGYQRKQASYAPN